MGEVVDFPTRSVRDWLIIERALHDALSSHQISDAVRARLTERMKSFYEFLDVDFSFSIDAEFPGVLTKAQTSAICTQIGERVQPVISEKLQAFTKRTLH